MKKDTDKIGLFARGSRRGGQLFSAGRFFAGCALVLAGCTTPSLVPDVLPSSRERLFTQASFPVNLEALADSLNYALLAQGQVPGLTLALAKDGDIFFARGYGQADVEMKAPAGLETVYKVNALTQQVTAAIVLRLAEAGKLSLDDPVTKYLPEFPAQGHQVSIRHLLSHTAGLDLGHQSSSFQQAAVPPFTVAQGANQGLSKNEVPTLEQVTFRFSPGDDCQPSSLGYSLLELLIGRVTGISYAGYVEQELLQPLKLTRTRYVQDQHILLNRAKGYTSIDGALMNAPAAAQSMNDAAGTLSSTVGDLVRWTHLLHSGEVITPASLRQMAAPTVLSTGDTLDYGFGFALDRIGEHGKMYQVSSGQGFGTYLSHYPADGLTIVLLANSAQAMEKMAAIEQLLAATVLKVQLPNPIVPAPDRNAYAEARLVPSVPVLQQATWSDALDPAYPLLQNRGVPSQPYRLEDHEPAPGPVNQPCLGIGLGNSSEYYLLIRESPRE